MNERIRVGEDLAAALSEPSGPVFQAIPTDDTWEACVSELTEAYEMSRRAVEAGEPLVYVVHNDDLLGRRGAGAAMVATGLLSAARTLALETAREGIPVNVIAIDDETAVERLAIWVGRLLESGGPTGELVHLTAGHLGKALA